MYDKLCDYLLIINTTMALLMFFNHIGLFSFAWNVSFSALEDTIAMPIVQLMINCTPYNQWDLSNFALLMIILWNPYKIWKFVSPITSEPIELGSSNFVWNFSLPNTFKWFKKSHVTMSVSSDITMTSFLPSKLL